MHLSTPIYMLRKCRVPQGLVHHDPVYYDNPPTPCSDGVWVDIGHGLWVLLTPIWDEIDMWVPVFPGHKEGNSSAFKSYYINTTMHIYVKHANLVAMSSQIMDSCTRTSISMGVTAYMTCGDDGEAGAATIMHTHTDPENKLVDVASNVYIMPPRNSKIDAYQGVQQEERESIEA
jgi:hypothetical protein